MNRFFTLIMRDTLQAWRQGGSGLLVVVFFALTVTLFPLGVGPDLSILAKIGAGIVWVAALLSAVLSLDRVFSLDYEDGSLDLLFLVDMPLEIQVAAKALSHWLNSLGPVILVTPLMALVLNLDGAGLKALILAMVIGTPALSFFGVIAAALAASVKRGGVLIPLLVLPLYVPTLIYGVTAVQEALAGGGNMEANLLRLAAVTTFSIAVGPIAGAAAIKITAE